MGKNTSWVFAILILTFLIWSNSFIAIGYLRQQVTALELVKLRFWPVGVISLTLVGLFFRTEARRLLRHHPLRIVAMGFLNVTFYNFLLNSAMSYVKPGASSLLVCLNPLFTLLLAVRFLGERMTLRRLAGTVVTFAGLVVVVVYGRVGMDNSVVIPLERIPYALMVVAASLGWAVYSILSKPLVGRYSPVAVNFVTLSVGTLPFFFLPDAALFAKIGRFGGLDFFAVGFLSIGCTVIAFALWNIALKHWRASNVALFVYLNPPLTAVFAFFLLGQGITLEFFLGAAVMLSGIILATYPARRRLPLPAGEG